MKSSISGLKGLVGLFGILVFLGSPIKAAGTEVSLAWDRNLAADVAGYNVYYGTLNQTYSQTINASNAISITISNLAEGVTYYFAVTAYSTNSLESDFSNEVSTLATLRITSLQISGGQAQVTLPTVSGRTYRIDRNDTLATNTWVTVGTSFPGNGGRIQINDPFLSGPRARFYRAVLLLP